MPQNHGPAPAVPRTPLGVGTFESLAGMYRIVRTMFSACSRRLDVVDEDAHQPEVERVLDDPLGLFARIGRESREHGRVCLRVAPLENAGLVRHAREKYLQLIEAHGAVFHVEVDEVDVGVSRQ